MIAKMIRDEDGCVYDNDYWHLVETFSEDPRILCTSEVFDSELWEGQGNAWAEVKEKGKITCPHCITMIKWFKEIKL